MKATYRCLIIAALFIFFSALTAAQENFETAYNRLKTKIESELRQPPASNNDLSLYLSWMVIKARTGMSVKNFLTKQAKREIPIGKESSLISLTRLITPAKTLKLCHVQADEN